MRHIGCTEFVRKVLTSESTHVIFDGDESAHPERIILGLHDGSTVVIAAREDGCLDVVLEEA